MRKKCLLFLLCMLSTVVVFAGKEATYTLYEGFEDGLPASWTQEYSSEMQVSWAVEQSGASMYPEKAFKGNGLVALRNTTGQTQRFKTKLVTPVIDLTEVFQPIVVFSHAQLQYAGDVDALVVYYRTSASARWVELGRYTDKTKGWATDTIALTAPTATYQLAFEGVDNLGRGIALDEIIVRATPTCDVPENISADGLTSNSATLRWNGSLDTDSFRVVLSTTEQTDPDNLTNVVKDEFVSDFQWKVDSLERNTLYYVYIQANCGGAESEIATYTFRTKNLASVPYKQDFNMNYVQGYISHVSYWTHGTSILNDEGNMEFMPFINQNTTETNWKNYSYSMTSCLVFTGARAIATDIPAGHYVYAATPEMDVPSVSTLQATFWGTCYQSVGADYMSGLIVGVMTDPADFSTFVPVDTVYAPYSQTFDRFTVSFANYKGEGKYIAFASNFSDKNNIFYMDDLSIVEAPVSKPLTDVQIINCKGARFDINANLNGNSQVQVIVTNDVLDPATARAYMDPTLLAESEYVLNQVVPANQFPYTVQLPEGGKFVQVYMRGTDGTNFGDFTLPVKVLVPMKVKDEITITFETADMTNNSWQPKLLNNFSASTNSVNFPFAVITTPQNYCSTNPSYPSTYSSTGYGYNSNGCCMIGKELQEFAEGNPRCTQEIGDYIALPEVEDIKKTILEFYMKGYDKGTGCVAVGVMTDPFDVNTFDTIGIFEELNEEYKPVMVTFGDYKGQGTFPAIMAVDAPQRYKYSSTSGSGGSYTTYKVSYTRLDQISLYAMGDCAMPTSVLDDANFNQVEITWAANKMNQWEVKLFADADCTTMVDSIRVNENKCTFTNLKPTTTYYYTVATVCGEFVTKAIPYKFTTTCLPAETLPYFEGFEAWEGGSDTEIKEPTCWTMEKIQYYYSGGGESEISYYPYISSSTTSAHSGSKYLYFTLSSAKANAKQDLYAALPLMADTIQELQMQFYAKSSAGKKLYVGLMTDPNDVKTFDTVQVCQFTSSNYTEFIIRFDTYKGKGEYIAFLEPLAESSNYFYIDDIKVDYLSDCEKIQGVSARNASTSGADIYWQKGTATTWNVLLTTETIDELGSIVEVDSVKVLSLDTTNTMPFTISNCPEPNVQYYAYVRAVCDGSVGDWSIPTAFKTTCVPTVLDDAGVIDFTNKNELDCWTVGVREGTTANPSRNSNNYLYMFNSTASDGAYAIMPPLDVDSINRLQISFDAHGGNGAAYLRELTVGVISNPSDLSTFVAVKKLSLNKVSATTAATNYGFDEAARYTVRFDEYYGDYNGDYGKQIMFISESGELANYIYIKNILVDTIPACLEPVEVEVVETNTYDATIAWEKGGQNYQVQLLADDKQTVVADTLVAADTIQFTGLEMLTTYYAQVRQICAVGDTSVWSNLVKLTTTCPTVFPLPYSEDFEGYASGAGNLPNCWEGYTNSTTKYPYVYSTAKKDGKNGFYLYRSTSYASYAVLPPFTAKAADLMISFDYRNVNTSSYKGIFQVGVATDVTSIEGIDSTLTILDEVEVEPYKSPNNVWYYYSKTLADYVGEDGYLVLVAPKAAASASSGAIYIDNLYVEKAPTCFRPLNLALKTATASSVTLSWTPYGKENAWDVAYVVAGGNVDNATIVTVDASTVTITGLQASTDYDFYVRANCGDGEVSNWSDPAAASTVYVVELKDAQWNFDNVLTQVPSPLDKTYMLEKGWIVGNTESDAVGNIPYNLKNTYHSAGYVNNHYAKSDSCALKMGTTSATTNASYTILPMVNADYDTLQIRFFGRAVYGKGSKVQLDLDTAYYNTYSKGNYQHAIKVGTVTDPYDMSTFELLNEYTFQVVENSTPIVEDGYWEEVVVSLYGTNGKYIVLSTDYDKTNVVYVDDVVIEKESGCSTPTVLTVDTLTATSAKISWKSSKSQWKVQAIATANDSIVDEAVVATTTWTTNALEATEEYKLVVTAICGEDFSESNQVIVTTPCTAVADYKDFQIDFESNIVAAAIANQLPECWLEGKLTVGGTSTSYVSKVIPNTATYQYSRNRKETNTEAAALRLYNYSTTYYDSYVILPEMNFDMDSVSLHFWARAAYFYSSTYSTATSRNKLYAANNKYQRSLVIGAVADVNDLSTFVPLDTFTYSQSWSSNTNIYTTNDPTGNEYWEEVLIPLKEYEGKGRIMLLYPNSGATSYMFIDDMDIVPGDFCTAATNLRTTNLTSSSATLSWITVGNDSVRMQLAYDEEFAEDKLVIDTVLVNSGGKFEATNLKSGQDYYFRVQHYCSEDEIADWVTSSLFVTDYAVRFFEDFSALATYPVDWNRANNLPSDVFSGTKEINYVAETVTANWRRVSDCSFASTAIRSQASTGTSSTSQYWLLTPIIDMTTAPADQTVMLSFQMGLSGSGGGVTTPAAPQEDDKFIVAVSEDGGQTWSADNTTWWSDAEADKAAYSYAQIPVTGKMYTVDFSKYAGKRIRIAFINYSVKTASKNYIYIANVSINGVEVENYTATICQWEDFEDDNFSIDAYELMPGDTTVYEFYKQASKVSELDKTATLVLNVLNEAVTTVSATVCEGEDYTLDNFNILNATASGVYKQKLQGANTCDSVVVLNLTVKPRVYTDITETICQGDYYEFNGVKYYTNIVKTDTLTSLVTGCDSVVTLYLTVNAMLEGEEEAHLCPGDYVEFAKFGQITEAGTYVDTVKNALMCDSVATLYVFTHENEATTVRAAICQGESYSQANWAGLTKAGDYPVKLETVWGCDSVVTLHLLVAGADQTIYDKIAVEELPYVLNGEVLLSVGTTDGVYTKLVDLSCGTMTVVITVGESTGVANVFSNTLALAPNTVAVGQETSVIGTFAADAVLEVYQATGALVYRSNEVNRVPGMSTSGVYVVVVKSGNQLYQSMLIVQ